MCQGNGEVTAAHPFCDMLLSVGKGIAMGNASEKVKAIAADICKSVADDGIYHYLKKQGMINE